MRSGCLHKGIFDLFKLTGDCNIEKTTAEIRVMAFPSKQTHKNQNCAEWQTN